MQINKNPLKRTIHCFLIIALQVFFLPLLRAAPQPNIILIVADDLGYADVGVHGCKDIPTPHMDSIAKNGVRFTQGYVTAAVCSPTRAGMLTGRYQQRFGSGGNPGPHVRKGEVCGVALSEKMLGNYLKERGYRTACFGKWHLGGERGDIRLFPLNRGFDEFYGFLEGAARYEDVRNVEKKYMRGNVLLEGEKAYYTDALGREAVSFITRNKDKPFFLYLPFNAVHAPMQASQKYLQKFKHIENLNRRKLCAMNYAMDVNIGRVLKTLEKHRLTANSLIFFISDNGGKPKNNFSQNHPFRGQKGEFYDGGIHIPFFMQWKGSITPGTVYKHPVSSLDILPTILAATGEIPNKNFDGVDLLPYLNKKKNGQPHKALFWKSGNQSAARIGHWKFVKRGRKTELFNLAADPYEKKNIAASNQEKLQKLQSAYKIWDAKNVPPKYGWNKAIGPKQQPPSGWKNRLTP